MESQIKNRNATLLNFQIGNEGICEQNGVDRIESEVISTIAWCPSISKHDKYIQYLWVKNKLKSKDKINHLFLRPAANLGGYL